MVRIGYGNDIHRLVSGRRLIIGGVDIPSDVGAEGHSDADVLLHAITDALLGALALGDIGTHFPNTDERWLNVESAVFLRYSLGLITSRGYKISNIDSTVGLENVKLRPHIDKMRENIAIGGLRASARLVELIDSESDHVSADVSKHTLAIAGIKPRADAQVSVNIDIKAGYVIDLTDEPKRPPMIDVTRD